MAICPGCKPESLQEDRTIPTGHAVESKYGGCLRQPAALPGKQGKRLRVGYHRSIHKGQFTGGDQARVVKGYPGTGVIYGEVKKLETFAAGHGGKRVGYPMVNIDPLAGDQFQLRTAIPVDRHFEDEGGHFLEEAGPGPLS